MTELTWDGSEKHLERCEDGGALSGGVRIIQSRFKSAQSNIKVKVIPLQARCGPEGG